MYRYNNQAISTVEKILRVCYYDRSNRPGNVLLFICFIKELVPVAMLFLLQGRPHIYIHIP